MVKALSQCLIDERLNNVSTCVFEMCLIGWDSPEAMKDKAMEADRLFRRGCLQYREDLGLF